MPNHYLFGAWFSFSEEDGTGPPFRGPPTTGVWRGCFGRQKYLMGPRTVGFVAPLILGAGTNPLGPKGTAAMGGQTSITAAPEVLAGCDRPERDYNEAAVRGVPSGL